MRYAKDYQDIAKKEGLALFTIDINRKFLIDEGGSSTITGACHKEHYPYLKMAMRICQGAPVDTAMLFLKQELQGMASE